MKQKIYIIGIITVLLLVTGTIFKVNHWPGASVLLCLGTLLLLAIFMPSALTDHYRANGNRQYLILYFVTWLTCFVVFTAMLFKILHWPGAGIAIFVALPFPFVVFFPVYLLVTAKIKGFDINNTIYILFLLASQAVFSALLALNVSRERIHDSQLLTNQYSTMNLMIEKLPVIQSSGSEAGKQVSVNQAADELLTLVADCKQRIIQKAGKASDGSNFELVKPEYLDSRSLARDALLLGKEPVPAYKLKAGLDKFIEEIKKIPGSGELVTLAYNLFDLTERSDELPWPEKMFATSYLSWVLTDLNAMEVNVRLLRQDVLRLVK